MEPSLEILLHGIYEHVFYFAIRSDKKRLFCFFVNTVLHCKLRIDHRIGHHAKHTRWPAYLSLVNPRNLCLSSFACTHVEICKNKMPIYLPNLCIVFGSMITPALCSSPGWGILLVFSCTRIISAHSQYECGVNSVGMKMIGWIRESSD